MISRTCWCSIWFHVWSWIITYVFVVWLAPGKGIQIWYVFWKKKYSSYLVEACLVSLISNRNPGPIDSCHGAASATAFCLSYAAAGRWKLFAFPHSEFATGKIMHGWSRLLSLPTCGVTVIKPAGDGGHNQAICHGRRRKWRARTWVRSFPSPWQSGDLETRTDDQTKLTMQHVWTKCMPVYSELEKAKWKKEDCEFFSNFIVWIKFRVGERKWN
jgi:hypothetical protein